MPEELNARVEVLIGEVRAVRQAIDRRTRWVWGAIAAVVVVGALTVGGAYYLIDRNNERQQAQAAAQAVTLCRDWKARAEARVLDGSSEAVRSGVRTAVDAYQLTRCAALTGPLGPADPRAYQPAPKQ